MNRENGITLTRRFLWDCVVGVLLLIAATGSDAAEDKERVFECDSGMPSPQSKHPLYHGNIRDAEGKGLQDIAKEQPLAAYTIVYTSARKLVQDRDMRKGVPNANVPVVRTREDETLTAFLGKLSQYAGGSLRFDPQKHVFEQRKAKEDPTTVVKAHLSIDEFSYDIDCTNDNESSAAMSSAVLLIAYARDAIQVAHKAHVAKSQDKVADAVESKRQGMSNYLLENGLGQWPWELALNSWLYDLKDVMHDPKRMLPKGQFVAMRPVVGMGLSYPRAESADATGVVGLEPIGYVWYSDTETYKSWKGISLLATVGTEGGAGIGALLRWNEFTAGYVFRSGHGGDFLFIGVDLYGLIVDKEKRDEWLQRKGLRAPLSP